MLWCCEENKTLILSEELHKTGNGKESTKLVDYKTLINNICLRQIFSYSLIHFKVQS